MKIGFIGLGNMGAPMARNLAKAGHEVTGFDVNFEQASALRDILTIVETAADAAVGQDVVITMLPNGGALHDVAAEIVPLWRHHHVLSIVQRLIFRQPNRLP